ncbi:MAG TPA: hypothetical protein VFA07_17625 [Chthonomonadaceae bacterium]|nr:hypothetical protein [Chthonomonadaceae bacterium]
MQKRSLWMGIALAGMLWPLAAHAQNAPAPPPVRTSLEVYHGQYVLDIDTFDMRFAPLETYWDSLVNYEFEPPRLNPPSHGQDHDRMHYRGTYLLDYDFTEWNNADLDNYWDNRVNYELSGQ